MDIKFLREILEILYFGKDSITTLVGTLLRFISTYFIIGQKWNDEFASTWCLISLPGVLLGEIYYIK
tara:strand:+ start:45 stop:245 length:201 start_codon:yes stop_codon:yes gene_type:complete